MKKTTVYITEVIDGVHTSYKQDIIIDSQEDTIVDGGVQGEPEKALGVESNELKEANEDRKVPRKRSKV